MKLFLGLYDHDDESGLSTGDTVKVTLVKSPYVGRVGTVTRFSGGKRMFVYVRFVDEGTTRKFGKSSVKLVSSADMEEEEAGPQSQMDAAVVKAWVKELTMSDLSIVLMMVAQEMAQRSKQVREG